MPKMAFAAAGGLFAVGISSIGTAQPIVLPYDLRGSYAPRGDCNKQPKVVLTDVLTIYDGVGRWSLAHLDACLSCAGGARYEGIEVWAAQLGADGEPKDPMFIFNSGEERGVLFVDKAGMENFSPAVRAVALGSSLKRRAK